MSGTGFSAIQLVAYTQHLPGDTNEDIGFGLFLAVALDIDIIDLQEIPMSYEKKPLRMYITQSRIYFLTSELF